MRVINVRGNRCCGKSTLLKRFIHRDHSYVWDFGYRVKRGNRIKATINKDIAVMGVYNDGSISGGADWIQDYDKLELAMLKLINLNKCVLFEGGFISADFKRWYDFSQKVRKTQEENIPAGRKYGFGFYGMLWAFLDTPMEKMRRRLVFRKAKSGKPLNWHLSIDRQKQIESCKRRAAKEGECVITLKHKTAYEELRAIIGDQYEYE